MPDLQKTIDSIKKLRDDRDWKQFHNPKNLAISISLEANELLEHFQWLNMEQSENYANNPENREELADEMADILHYLLELSDNLGIDILKASESKIKKAEEKYPVDKSKGRAVKYDKL
jgi:NTP pyrophosphatase (non-canonical NTP hydrolase)